MNVWDAAKLALIVATPTLFGALILYAPKWFDVASAYWEARKPPVPQPVGPPIEQLAADLRRLLRLHASMTASAHMAMRAHRLWAVEAAIAVRAVEAARALELPHRVPCSPGELESLLRALTAAGLVLPAQVGRFTSDGRL
ncbi:hypothetical protein BJ973_003145 [Actinoplanes tereljensis]|uniref:Uncharacterized protein n=1 Tax=Paractinoplanes tereljensis TaxID=571912 RepID=A0A919NYY1_9ACTN|nr:hypothetical protein [Actinoplanes tereljensis]GIF25872.1 hypothetical protein Ate02nite_86020 [Actinoplanes tereljensis]